MGIGPANADHEFGFANLGDRGLYRTDPRTGEAKELVGAVPPDPADDMKLPPGMMLDEQGKAQWIPDYIEGYQRMHPRAAGGSGGLKIPSGYRPNADGTGLEPIPGGPADKPEVEYTATERSKYKAQAQGLDAIEFAVKEYRDAVKRHGTKLIANPNDTDVAELEGTHNSLMMLLKSPDMFQLGVLTGPDLDLLEKSVTPPTGRKSFGADADTIGTRLNVLDRFLAQKRGSIPQQFQTQKELPQSPQVGAERAGYEQAINEAASGAFGPGGQYGRQPAFDIEAEIDAAFAEDDDEDDVSDLLSIY
jgi:hypothetical protein